MSSNLWFMDLFSRLTVIFSEIFFILKTKQEYQILKFNLWTSVFNSIWLNRYRFSKIETMRGLSVWFFALLHSFVLNQSQAVFAYYYYIDHPIDLSHPIDENTIFSDSSESVRVSTLSREKFYTTYILYQEQCLPEHGSTHVDAPRHFNKNGWTISDIPLSLLMTEGKVFLKEKKIYIYERFLTFTICLRDECFKWDLFTWTWF